MLTRYDPLRERHMLDYLKENNNGPLNQMTVDYIFKANFQNCFETIRSRYRKKNYLFHVKENQKIQLLKLMVKKLEQVSQHSYLVHVQ